MSNPLPNSESDVWDIEERPYPQTELFLTMREEVNIKTE